MWTVDSICKTITSDIEETLYGELDLENVHIKVNKMDDGTRMYALFDGDEQFSEAFDEYSECISSEGCAYMFEDCIIVRRDGKYNVINLLTGHLVLPYWVDDIDLSMQHPYITLGDYEGYVEVKNGVIMECGVGTSWWAFNWD